MTDLEVRGLHKSYGSQPVLRGLDLRVEAGSFTSILGASGSGKTTLLRVIAGFERAERGEVRLGGETVEAEQCYVPPERRRVGFVPQDGSLFPHLTVERNVAFGLARGERHGRRVSHLIHMAGLGGLEKRYPHQLSGGQQQRVALARALAIEPALVLLDEPFASLDAGLRAGLRREVRQLLKDAGTTAVLVTHDQDEALSLADSVAFLSGGRIAQHASPQQLYARPSTPELARGLGESNFLRGSLARGGVQTPLGLLELDPGAQAPGVGSPLLVLVRAEQIELHDDAASQPVRGRVLSSEFYGHDAVVKLACPWDDAVVLTARISQARAIPTAGAEVGVSVRGGVVVWAESDRSGQEPDQR